MPDNQLILELNKVIAEELGISRIVWTVSNKIYSLIEKSFRENYPTQKEEKSDGVWMIRNDFEYYFPNVEKEITIRYEIVNFKNAQHMDLYATSCDIRNDGYSMAQFFKNIDKRKKGVLGFGTIAVYGVAISGTIQKNALMDTIQHEVEHLYQQIMMGKEFGDEGIGVITNSLSSKNKFVKTVALFLYMSLKSEQEGFANGLYAYCHENFTAFPEKYKESPAYEMLQNLDKGLELFKENIGSKGLKDALNEFWQFNLTAKNIIPFCEKVMRQCIRRFGRVYALLNREASERIKDFKPKKLS